MKNIILQKEATRYSFTVIPKTNVSNEKVCVTCEKKLQTGHGTSSDDYISVEKAEEKVKELLEDGFIPFRTISEVSWYATRPNNTPYEEIWEVKDGFFIPKESHSVYVTTIDGHSCELVNLWGKGTGWPTKYYIGKESFAENGSNGEWYYAKAVVSEGEYKGTYCFKYEDYPDRGEVEDDLLNLLSNMDIDRQESNAMAAGGYYIVTF